MSASFSGSERGTELKLILILNTEEIVGEPPPLTPKQKLEDLIRLAELCVDLLRQNEEFYAEVLL